ncbi:MAG: barstar family protein [Acidobacteriota bacterium]
MRTHLDHLFEPGGPYVSAGLGESERRNWNTQAFYARPGLRCCARNLRGPKMRTVQGLMNEFPAALQFFDDFGENWYALEECLSYLDEWLPADAYILVIERCEELLKDEPGELTTFLKVLHAVGSFWSQTIDDKSRFSRKAIPFNVLLHFSQDSGKKLRRLREVANQAGVPLHESS